MFYGVCRYDKCGKKLRKSKNKELAGQKIAYLGVIAIVVDVQSEKLIEITLVVSGPKNVLLFLYESHDYL